MKIPLFCFFLGVMLCSLTYNIFGNSEIQSPEPVQTKEPVIGYTVEVTVGNDVRWFKVEPDTNLHVILDDELKLTGLQLLPIGEILAQTSKPPANGKPTNQTFSAHSP